MSSSHEELVLHIHNLSVTYPDGTRALHGLDLALERGCMLAVIGESGCGKSTLIAAILGLLPRNTRVNGSLRICGKEIVGASGRRAREIRQQYLGYVPQDPYAAVDPLHPVVHHIRFAAKAAGKAIDRHEIEEHLLRLGIDRKTVTSRHWPHQWSGGMLQRACIAAATIATPTILLADEPTSALDPDTGTSVLTELQKCAESLVIVTHDLDVAILVADEIAVFSNGRMVERGEATRVLTAPTHAETVSLIEAARWARGTEG